MLGIVRHGGAVAALAIGLVVSRWPTTRTPSPRPNSTAWCVRSEELARENLAAEPDEGEFLDLDPFNPDDFERSSTRRSTTSRTC